MFIAPVLYKDKGFIQMHRIEYLIAPKAKEYFGLYADALILLFLIYLAPHTRSLSLNKTRLAVQRIRHSLYLRDDTSPHRRIHGLIR